MKKVLIGMSGGVDSSVAALILKQQGYEVVGATFKLFDEHDLLLNTESKCCSIDDVTDARFVCDTIGIPHYVFNYKDLFRKKVVDYFVDSYINGSTPNPCIACNRHIKFDAFISKALSMDFDYIATGHYARIEYDKDTGIYSIHKATNPEKDQSYVLYNQTQHSLSHILMPLGIYSKAEVREIAEKNGLIVAKKSDSQDICFVPDGDYAGFIESYTGKSVGSGDFVDTHGNVIGKHRGYYHFTVGQRRGIGTGFGKKVYVVDIDAVRNRVVLGDYDDLFTDSIYAKDVQIISEKSVSYPFRCTVKLRYSHKGTDAVVDTVENERIKITFDTPQKSVAKGQSVVFYNGDMIIGGGEIE